MNKKIRIFTHYTLKIFFFANIKSLHIKLFYPLKNLSHYNLHMKNTKFFRIISNSYSLY